MRWIELHIDEFEEILEKEADALAFVPWEEVDGSVLDVIDKQLAEFGLELVMHETGSCSWLWKIEQRVVQGDVA